MAQQQPLICENDYILPFTIDELNLRGRSITLGPAVNQILKRHNYPQPVAHILAQMLCATALIGSSLKFKGKLTLQTSSNGLINLLVCDFIAPSAIRAYARFDNALSQEKIIQNQIDFKTLIGEGHLAFTIQKEDSKQLYQGLVSLEGDNFDKIIENYFQQSEQIPTKIKLASAKRACADTGSICYCAGGMMIQHLPHHQDVTKKNNDKNEFFEASTFFSTIDSFELIDPKTSPKRLLFRLFHEYETRVFEKISVIDQCSCSRQKIENLLKSFSEEELTKLPAGPK